MIPVTETSVKDVIFFVHQIFILCIFRIRSEDNKSELRGFNRFQNDNLEFLKFFGRWDRKILWPRKQDLTNKLQHISFTLIFFLFHWWSFSVISRNIVSLTWLFMAWFDFQLYSSFRTLKRSLCFTFAHPHIGTSNSCSCIAKCH